jgi:molybdopterin-guanine dinucleotide biosynthesis adapter protein
MSDKPLIVSVVGHHNVGKSTIGTEMVSIWTQMGLRVAVLKHDGHADQLPAGAEDDWEKPGSDTRRMTEAGAVFTMVTGGGQTLLRTVQDRYASDADKLVTRLQDHATGLGQRLNVILVEGYKKSHLPKVVVVAPDEVNWFVEEGITNVQAVIQSPLYDWTDTNCFDNKCPDNKCPDSANLGLNRDKVVPTFTQNRLTVYHKGNLQDLCDYLWSGGGRT